MKWIKVEDQFPKKNKRCYIYVEARIYPCVTYLGDGVWSHNIFNFTDMKPTHWMSEENILPWELPTPPTT